MTAPLVSVCLPNLNTMPFLQERIDTILAQTYPNWELIVSDNLSDDGAWEFFEDLARRDRRVSIAQAPREGLYANWNRCIARARGDFVYIATSDDTMADDCIEKLVAALQAHPHCDVAHCRLRIIDEAGNAGHDWWSSDSIFAESSGPLINCSHVRAAPFDGVLHLLGASVYISITQLLIRRSLFDRIGVFEPGWGSVSDFNWNMRAGLVANTVHVPDTWGGWRCHPTQATASADFGSAAHAARIDAMIDHAIGAVKGALAPDVQRLLEGVWAGRAKELRRFEREVAKRPGARRPLFVLREATAGSAPARIHLAASLSRRPFTDWVVGWLEAAGVSPLLVPTAGGPSRPGYMPVAPSAARARRD